MRRHPFGLIYTRLSFAGRNSELEQLRTLYLQGRHVLIVGPPGIGKRRCSMNSGRALRF
jgi:MoxR-like ATPase